MWPSMQRRYGYVSGQLKTAMLMGNAFFAQVRYQTCIIPHLTAPFLIC